MAVDREYRIKIVTVGDPSGANAAGSAIDDLGKKTAKAGEAAAKSAKEGLDRFAVSGREVRMLVEQAAPGIEGLGHVVTGLTNPFVVAGFAMVGALSALSDFNKALDEAAAKNAAASFADQINLMREGVAAGKQALMEFHFEMEKTASETERLNTALENNIKLMKLEADAGKEHGKDMGESPMDQARRDEQEHAAEIAARSRALQEAKARGPELAAKVIAADEAANAEETKRKVAGTQLKSAEEQHADLKTANDKAQAALEKFGFGNSEAAGKLSEDQLAGMSMFTASRFRPALAAAQLSANALSQNQTEIERNRAVVESPTTAALAAKAAHDEFTKNKATIDSGQTGIDTDRAGFFIKDEQAKRHALDTSDIGGGFTGASVEQAAQLVQLMAQHRQLTQAQQQALQQLQPIVDILRNNTNLTLQVAGSATDLARNQAGLLSRVNALDLLISQVQKQLANSAMYHGNF